MAPSAKKKDIWAFQESDKRAPNFKPANRVRYEKDLAAWNKKAAVWVAEKSGRTQEQFAAKNPAPTMKPASKRDKKFRALKEIRYYQKLITHEFPRHRFQMLVREIMEDFKPGFRIQSSALFALQEIAEHTLVTLFTATNKATIHRGQVTIKPKDMRFVLDLLQSSSELAGLYIPDEFKATKAGEGNDPKKDNDKSSKNGGRNGGKFPPGYGPTNPPPGPGRGKSVQALLRAYGGKTK